MGCTFKPDNRIKVMKKCCTCKILKLPSEFSSDPSKKDCKQSKCKECKSEYDKGPTQRYSLYRHGAKRRKIEFELTKEQFVEFWGKDCTYCGDQVDGIGLDRVDNSKGYTVDNVVPCCGECNRFKWGMTGEEFISHCTKIAKFNS